MLAKILRFFYLWSPVVLWAGVIYAFSSISNLEVVPGEGDLVLRKLAHLFEFGFMAVLIDRALGSGFRLDGKAWFKDNRFYLSMILTILYALSDEYHQTQVPTRTGKGTDILIDSAGAFLGLLFLRASLAFIARNPTVKKLWKSSI